MKMTIFLYRWKIKTGKEKQFEENWEKITRAMHLQCGSYGSRLHLTKEGTYLAYAQWPDAQTRNACQLDGSQAEARKLMQDAIEEFQSVEELQVCNDLFFPHQL